MRGHRKTYGQRISSCIRVKRLISPRTTANKLHARRSGQCCLDKQSLCGWLDSFRSQTAVQRLSRSSSFCLHRPIYPERRTDIQIPSQTWLLLRPCFAVRIASIVLWKRGASNSNSSVVVLGQSSCLLRVTHKASNSTIEASKIVFFSFLSGARLFALQCYVANHVVRKQIDYLSHQTNGLVWQKKKRGIVGLCNPIQSNWWSHHPCYRPLQSIHKQTSPIEIIDAWLRPVSMKISWRVSWH